ncbi:hypothetical protein K7432_008792 [Basidiobolus ranarum]|uniref:Uncharacterized protein n=1 Tax=Basidiobolus ranarum TaxID=34480 RepID=A0ABR2VYY1_9FUNG
MDCQSFNLVYQFYTEKSRSFIILMKLSFYISQGYYSQFLNRPDGYAMIIVPNFCGRLHQLSISWDRLTVDYRRKPSFRSSSERNMWVLLAFLGNIVLLGNSSQSE